MSLYYYVIKNFPQISNNLELALDTIDFQCLHRNSAEKTPGKDVTNILKKISKDYDKTVRPHYGGEFSIQILQYF